jgi:chromosome transmission fidelity protein 1
MLPSGSAFHWLLENENTIAGSRGEAETKEADVGKAVTSEPDWVQQFVQQEKEDKKRDQEKDFAQTKARVAKLEERSNELIKRKLSLPGAGEAEDADLLVDVDEQDEAVPTWKRLLLEAEDDSDGTGQEHEDADADDRPKIIYCSRTHSQLSQFVKEIGKTPYRDKIRCVSLGSRKNLCVNDDVQRLKSSTAMTDKCLDLQDGKGKGDKGVMAKKARVVGGRKSGQRAPAKSACPYLEKKSQNIMRDYIVSDIRDIEQIAQKGRSLGACAYYGTRKAVPSAHVLCVPYPSLLHRKSREALGIKLKNAVVIIDEAHNLMETINDIYSVTVSIECITGAHHQLTEYLERYKLRLKPSNTQYVKQLLFILQKLQRFLSTAQEKKRKPLTATPYGLANEQSPTIDSETVQEETSMMTVHFSQFPSSLCTLISVLFFQLTLLTRESSFFSSSLNILINRLLLSRSTTWFLKPRLTQSISSASWPLSKKAS